MYKITTIWSLTLHTRTHGLLKSIPLIQSNFSSRFRHLSSLWKKYLIYHITYNQIFFKHFFKQKHLLIVSGNAYTLKQNTQCLQLKDSIIFSNIFLKHVSGNACILKQNTYNLRWKISINQPFKMYVMK